MLLEVTVAEEDSRHLVMFRGELDGANVGVAQHALVVHSCAVTVADLEDLSFLDASGMTVLLEAKRCMERQGRRLLVCNVHDEPLLIMDVTGVKGYLLGEDPREERWMESERARACRVRN